MVKIFIFVKSRIFKYIKKIISSFLPIKAKFYFGMFSKKITLGSLGYPSQFRKDANIYRGVEVSPRQKYFFVPSFHLGHPITKMAYI